MRLVLVDDDWKLSEKEDVIYIDGGLHVSHEEDDSLCDIIYREYNMHKPPKASLEEELARMSPTSANMPCYYQEYLALGKESCSILYFKDYFTYKYGFSPQGGDEHSFKNNKPSTT